MLAIKLLAGAIRYICARLLPCTVDCDTGLAMHICPLPCMLIHTDDSAVHGMPSFRGSPLHAASLLLKCVGTTPANRAQMREACIQPKPSTHACRAPNSGCTLNTTLSIGLSSPMIGSVSGLLTQRCHSAGASCRHASCRYQAVHALDSLRLQRTAMAAHTQVGAHNPPVHARPILNEAQSALCEAASSAQTSSQIMQMSPIPEDGSQS